ncbi:MAG: hypothetical protein VB857_08130 [Pirellulaceae bacterium]
MKNHYYFRHRHPTGITLIEVMFSAGIALFGVLVVVALVPLAGNEVRIGLQTDRMAALGRNAVKEFDIRGMRNPNQWCRFDGSAVYRDAAPGNVGWFTGVVNNNARFRPQPQSYAIDPRFVTRHGEVPFPYSHNAKWTIPRLSLRTQHPTQILANGNPAYLPLGPLAADQLFMARDDLVLIFPDDRTLLSRPSFGSPIRKRQYRGELSWLATVVPLNINVANQANRQYNDEYLLSIVVFSARNMALEKANAVDSEVANVAERTTNVILTGGGIGGGEIQLRHPIHKNVTNRQLYAENVLKLQTNSWLMLSGHLANNDSRKRHYRWYRVLNVSPAVVQKGVATRNVMLQGADWGLANNNTQATIMEGVVGVFERKIRLENSSLW